MPQGDTYGYNVMKLCFSSSIIIVGANKYRGQKVWRKIYKHLSAAYGGGLSSRMMRLIERPTRDAAQLDISIHPSLRPKYVLACMLSCQTEPGSWGAIHQLATSLICIPSDLTPFSLPGPPSHLMPQDLTPEYSINQLTIPSLEL